MNKEGVPVAKIPSEAVAATAARWENTISGYVVGNRPFYAHLKAAVTRLWRQKGSLEIFSRENGFFFFRFGGPAECKRILEEGPWLFDGRLIVLRKWSSKQNLDRDLISEVPIWIRFKNLSLNFWSEEGLSRAASVIGKPLYTDKATATNERISYARCFVEIKATSNLPNSILVGEGGEENVEVEYEWVPPTCTHCKSFGHATASCPGTHAWREKINNNDKMTDTSHEDGNKSNGGEKERISEMETQENSHEENIKKESNQGENDQRDEPPIDGNKEDRPLSNLEEEVAEEVSNPINIGLGSIGTTGKESQILNSHVTQMGPSESPSAKNGLEQGRKTAETSSVDKSGSEGRRNGGQTDVSNPPQVVAEVNPEWTATLATYKKKKSKKIVKGGSSKNISES